MNELEKDLQDIADHDKSNLDTIKKVICEIIDMNGGEDFTYAPSMSFHDDFISISCYITDWKMGYGKSVMIFTSFEEPEDILERIRFASAQMLADRESLRLERIAKLAKELEELSC